MAVVYKESRGREGLAAPGYFAGTVILSRGDAGGACGDY